MRSDAPNDARSGLVLNDVRIVDVVEGSVTEPRTVVIEEGTIVHIGEAARPVDAGATIFDGAGRYLIPGLWDSHVHVFSTEDEPEWAFPLYLLHGVTGIRDMGALWPIEAQQALRAQVASGEVLGPRIVLSGAWVDGSPGSWPGMFLADTPDQARAVVDRIAAEGWAAVKAYSMLDEASYLALAEAAHSHGLPLVGHIPEAVTLGTAIDAGQDGMEHFGRVTKACATLEDEMVGAIAAALESGDDLQAVMALMAGHNRMVLESWDAARCDDVLTRMREAGMHVSPTLVVADFYLGNRPAPDSRRMRMLPPAVRAAWERPDFRREAMTDEVRELAQESIALGRRTFRLAHETGVPILASTDASFANPQLFHGASLIDELQIYVETGLTPREALYTATVAPPRFFGLEDQDGTIAPGRRADLVVLADNPLEGLETLRTPEAVIVGGRLLDRAALDAMAADRLAAGRH